VRKLFTHHLIREKMQQKVQKVVLGNRGNSDQLAVSNLVAIDSEAESKWQRQVGAGGSHGG
jgi:hypothetical protein